MVLATPSATSQRLSLADELLLMLLNEESGFFHQVPGWTLNCTIVGAVLAELSLIGRIDTDMESLILLDSTETGDPILDYILRDIARESEQHHAQYWIERLAPHAEIIVDQTLDRLKELEILQEHEGDYWSLVQTSRQAVAGGADDANEAEFVKTRIARAIFGGEIPDPRDIIVICLANTCDVLRFIFQLDEDAEQRVALICKMDLIGQGIAEAVANNLTGPLVRPSGLTKSIPTVSMRRLLFQRHVRDRNIPALFADLAKEYGPVFQLRPPFAEPMTFIAGPDVNRWVQRHGRAHMTATKYLEGVENVYGAHGILPGLDGGDHYRMRKALQPSYARSRLEGQLDELFRLIREYMADWQVGDTLPVRSMGRLMINAQISPIMVSVESQDLIESVIEFKTRVLNIKVTKTLPGFLLNTPRMKRLSKNIGVMIERIQREHTPAKRANAPRDIVDDLLSLHASDPQLLPESSLQFVLSAPLLASMYLGDALGFAVYTMATQPELYDRIAEEAETLFADGDPGRDEITLSSMDVAQRFVKECLRMYPIVPMSMRDVMNTCVVEGYEIPAGTRVVIAQTSSHYMSDVFPDPETFDIDRYAAPRDEHLGPGYAPFGLGTHACLGFRWIELQLAANLLLIARHFKLEPADRGKKVQIDPFPTLQPSKKLKLLVSERRRELSA